MLFLLLNPTNIKTSSLFLLTLDSFQQEVVYKYMLKIAKNLT